MSNDSRTFENGDFFYEYRYPPLDFTYKTRIQEREGAEIPNAFGPDSNTIGVRINLENDDIVITQVGGPNNNEFNYFDDGFNGFVIEDDRNLLSDIVGVDLLRNDIEGFDASRVTLTPDSITVDLRGVRAFTDDRIRLDVEFAGEGLGQGLAVEEAKTVAFLYEGGLDRDGEIDLPGLNYWIDAREGVLPGQTAPLSERDLAFEFLRSDEFERGFGEPLDTADPAYLDDEALVNTLYENLLGRPADDAGEVFWLEALSDPGFDRADLLLEFVESFENAESLAFVDGLTEVSPGEWDFV